MISEKIFELCSKEEIIEALEHSTIMNNFVAELVLAKLKANEKKADKILEDNKVLLDSLSGKDNIESFLKAMRKLDENYNRFKNIMQGNELLEEWLKEYDKKLDEMEDYV